MAVNLSIREVPDDWAEKLKKGQGATTARSRENC